MLHNDFGLQPKKKVLTLYRPSDHYVLIIPPRGGEAPAWIVEIDDVLAIPEDTSDQILSHVRTLATGAAFFLTIALDLAHIYAEHIAATIAARKPRLAEAIEQRRGDDGGDHAWEPDGQDDTFNLHRLFPARGDAREGDPHAI
jgi:hypothetical protein